MTDTPPAALLAAHRRMADNPPAPRPTSVLRMAPPRASSAGATINPRPVSPEFRPTLRLTAGRAWDGRPIPPAWGLVKPSGPSGGTAPCGVYYGPMRAATAVLGGLSVVTLELSG